jgi:DtxR family transcriptional regulator, Mn-dependent transcriptional regulator
MQAERMADKPTVAVEDYLKALHRLGGADELVSTVDIAAELGVRSPSVTGMLKRLAEAGWVQYESGRGARLSRDGVREARRVIRRHRLVELFLHKVLGIDWSEIDAEAEALEHAISPRVEEAIARYLGEPLEDPHGHPIPTVEGQIARRKLQPLGAFRPGERIIIREVQDEDPARLRHWQELGLRPGAVATVLSHEPLDDIYELEVNGTVIRLGSEGLAGVQGERSR